MGQGLTHSGIQCVRAETTVAIEVIDLSSYRPEVLRQTLMLIALTSWMHQQELRPEGIPSRY
jgi:hypothetical protein